MIHTQLLDYPHGKVDLFEVPEARTLAFVFNNIVESDNSIDKGPSRFLLRERINVIRFTSYSLDWYQNIPIEFLLNLKYLLENRNECRRLSIGHSMGAYAAITLSKLFSIDACIAYAPQFNPNEFPDYRFNYALGNVVSWRHVIEKSSISDHCQYYLIYDSQDIDRIHAQKIRKFIPIHHYHEIVIPHASHEITAYLHEIQELKTTTLSIINGETLALKALRKNRLVSPRYLKSFSQILTYHQKLEHLLRLENMLTRILIELTSTKCSDNLSKHQFLTPNIYNNIKDNCEFIAQQINDCQDILKLKLQGFDEADYYQRYPDVRDAQINALFHYVAFGRGEGREFSIKSS